MFDSYYRGNLNEEYLILFDLNRSRNLDMPSNDHERLNLDKRNDDWCKAEFRF